MASLTGGELSWSMKGGSSQPYMELRASQEQQGQRLQAFSDQVAGGQRTGGWYGEGDVADRSRDKSGGAF